MLLALETNTLQLTDAQREDFPLTEIGVVVIGRNEATRLERSLRSVLGNGSYVVYVDSGSTDHSLDIAQALAVETVALESARPFTAARARNAGCRYLTSRHPNLEFIQFVDGDCEIASGWIDAAAKYMASHPEVGVVCGELTEHDSRRSIYKRLSAMEWVLPVGETEASGGIAFVRTEAFQEVNGFDETFIAGEEWDLCFRVRQKGWRIWRLPEAMAVHNAGLNSLSQWWIRSVRSGHVYAERAGLYGKQAADQRIPQIWSAVFWGLALPLAISALALISLIWLPWTWVGVGALWCTYGILLGRVVRYRRQCGDRFTDALLNALFCVLSKFAQVVGALRYWWSHLRGKQRRLIEYKSA